MPVSLIGDQREALLDESDRIVTSPPLMGEQAGVVQRIRMLWRDFEYPGVELLGLGEVLLFLQPDGDGDGLVDRQLPRRQIRRVHRYPILLAFRSYLKCSPGSSDPSARCLR